jgi:hypothetical protein
MSNPRSFCTIAKCELNRPSNFLPSGLQYNESGELFWTSNAYATWKDTPAIEETASFSVLEQSNYVSLPPTMERISTGDAVLLYLREYIQEYKNTSAVLELWIRKHNNASLAETTIIIWREMCDKLLESPHFTHGWCLPAFYSFYSYQCMASIDYFFDTNCSIYPNKEMLWAHTFRRVDPLGLAYLWYQETFPYQRYVRS